MSTLESGDPADDDTGDCEMGEDTLSTVDEDSTVGSSVSRYVTESEDDGTLKICATYYWLRN